MKNVFYELRQNLHNGNDLSKLKLFKNKYVPALFEHSLWYLCTQECEEISGEEKEEGERDIKRDRDKDRESDRDKDRKKRYFHDYFKDLACCKKCLKIKNLLHKRDHLKPIFLNPDENISSFVNNIKELQIYFLGDYYSEKNFIGPSQTNDSDNVYLNTTEKSQCFQFGQVLAEEKSILFSRILKSIGLSEQEIFFSALSKCRPLDCNSIDDTSLDILASNCMEFTNREIVFLRPKIVITLGAYVSGFIVGRKERLSNIHGKFFKHKFYHNNLSHECEVIPLFGLDYLLINPQVKRVFWEDLKKVINFLNKS